MAIKMKAKILRKRVRKKVFVHMQAYIYSVHIVVYIQYIRQHWRECPMYIVYTSVYSVYIVSIFTYFVCMFLHVLHVCIFVCMHAIVHVRKSDDKEQVIRRYKGTVAHLQCQSCTSDLVNTMKRGREIRIRGIGYLFMRQYILDMSGILNLKIFNHNFP